MSEHLPSVGVVTPERVSVELPVAGIGFRALAYAVDVGVLGVTAFVLYFLYSLVGPSALDVVEGLSSLERASGALILFVTIWGYWTGLEVAWRGQTLGKRLVGIRVVRFDGSPIGPFESAVRNLLRLIDFMPLCYPAGVITMLIDRRHRRLGDLVAGTILVREEAIDLSRYVAEAPRAARQLDAPQLELVTSYLDREASLDADARLRLGRGLATRLGADATQWNESDIRSFLRSFGNDDSSGGAASFVKKRHSDWTALEALIARLRGKNVALDELSTIDRLYRRASADLAHAQTFFGGSDVHRFLNQLCGNAYGLIYQRPPFRLSALKSFFVSTFPATVRETLAYTRFAAWLMIGGLVVGVATVALSPSGADVLLDPHLLDLIRRRELWTDQLLERLHPAEAAVSIFTNNLRVAFLAFATGITAAIGTVGVLVFNGVHVGAILTACTQNDVGFSMLSFMFAHGPIELSIIAITGAAGLFMGHGLIDPGERARGVVLRERGRKAIQLVLGCAPFLVAIGIVEGFVSPGSLFPWPLKLLLGAGTGFAFWRYLLRSGR